MQSSIQLSSMLEVESVKAVFLTIEQFRTPLYDCFNPIDPKDVKEQTRHGSEVGVDKHLRWIYELKLFFEPRGKPTFKTSDYRIY